MSLSEFDLIDRYFRRPLSRSDVFLGVGDDAAVLELPPGKQLVVAMDTLVAGRHFPEQTSPFDIAWKALAVNLSDLAAMGAVPAWATLSLTLPDAEEGWLKSFAEGFFTLADQYGIELVGGDTTRGPLTVTVQMHGWVDAGTAVQRSGAKAGQSIYVTGTPGDAALALRGIQAGQNVDAYLLERLNRPQARVRFGQRLVGVASAAIDISDGLYADLAHILQASGCGASLRLDRIPASEPLKAMAARERFALQLTGGDDYELCFTVAESQLDRLEKIAAECAVKVSRIGVVEAQAGIRCTGEGADICVQTFKGFDHFRVDES